jgi:hypothetical protein
VTSDGPTLFDFANPLELRVLTIAAAIEPTEEPETQPASLGDEADAGSNADDITAELARLFEERLEPQPIDGAVKKARKRPGR